MSDFEVRKAKNEDFNDIQKIGQMHFVEQKESRDSFYNVNWSFSDQGNDYYKKAINDADKNCFVAIKDNQIVGFLNASSRLDPKLNGLKIAEIDEIFVLPDYRDKGIGSELMKYFLKWRQEIGANRIVVQTFSLDNRAIHFYKKHGFDDFVAELKQDFGN